MTLTGHMRREFIPELETKFCSISQMKRHLASKERLLWSNMSEGAEHILEGLTTNTRHPNLELQSEPLPAPPEKSEMPEVLNGIGMMGQNLQMIMSASQSNSHPGPQLFAYQLAAFPSSQRMDHPHPGAAGNSCFMCNEMALFLNHCPVLLEYIQLGKAVRNPQKSMVMLRNGDPIPSKPGNLSMGHLDQ